eukprot:6341429-Prorocentrum_lima.AAC.1
MQAIYLTQSGWAHPSVQHGERPHADADFVGSEPWSHCRSTRQCPVIVSRESSRYFSNGGWDSPRNGFSDDEDDDFDDEDC